ncbi:zinc ribbon domain-containing protein [Streptomyces sp. 71268]|uniref:zinc ribbon domain-containing protein n=1 Tax=Streptomyces sp. 71268 TaxID=3002640 RepID=UPI0023F9CE80|nr:zinc ribbon domain-containing protein [Streptomyces sp. 71268]WEV29289.1 zinc ribbon domain-containing protein [Streptomyces sp. 71268]
MAAVPEPRVLAQVSELTEEAATEQRGALWRLAVDQRQLDANVIRLPPGARVAAHLEARLDVLLYVIEGDGHLTGGGEAAPEGGAVGRSDEADEADRADGAGEAQAALGPGALVWLPHGSRRALYAGAAGLTYLTVHRRRPGLTVGAPAPVERTGGEAACLLHRVCVECGRLAPETDARYCGRCGTALPEH